MPDHRITLHNRLVAQIADPSLKIMFNPQRRITLEYPCIVYALKDMSITRANNRPYASGSVYQVTFMSLLPGEEKALELINMENTRFINTFVNDDIIHHVYEMTVGVT